MKLSLHFCLTALVAVGLIVIVESKVSPVKIPPRKPKSNDASICNARLDDNNPGIAKEYWDSSGAGAIGDRFIDEYGMDDWVQGLDEHIFNQTSDSWYCYDFTSICQLERDCQNEYFKTSFGGAYFLFLSVQNARSFLNELHEAFQDNAIKDTLGIQKIVEDFKFHKSDEPVDALSILAGIFTVLGAVVPGGGAIYGTMAGVTSLIAAAPSPEKVDKEVYGITLATEVKEGFEYSVNVLDGTAEAIFGGPKYKEAPIPKHMQKGDHKHAAIRALGEGQWLLDNPTAGVEAAKHVMHDRMRQSLAWTMMRKARHTFILVDDDIKDEANCKDDFNIKLHGWDPERKLCFILFWHDEKGRLVEVPRELVDKLWGDYNIDRLEAFGNAYDCWIDNKGNIGDPVETPLKGTELAKCFYGMNIVRGRHRGLSWGRGGALKMSKFPGQVEGKDWHPDTIADIRPKVPIVHKDGVTYDGKVRFVW